MEEEIKEYYIKYITDWIKDHPYKKFSSINYGKTLISSFSEYIILTNNNTQIKIYYFKRNIFGVKKYTTFGKLMTDHLSTKNLEVFVKDFSESERLNIQRRIKFKKILKKK